MLFSFRLVLDRGKTGKEIPKSSRLEFLEMFSANSFPLSDAELLNLGKCCQLHLPAVIKA